MGIEIRIEASDALDAQKQMAALLAGMTPLTAVRLAEDTGAAPRRGRNKTIEPKPGVVAEVVDEGNAPTSSTDESTSSSGTASTQTEAGPSDQEGEPKVEYADVQRAVTSLAAARGRDAVMAVFNHFGVDHGTKLKPEQYVDAVAELEKAREAA